MSGSGSTNNTLLLATVGCGQPLSLVCADCGSELTVTREGAIEPCAVCICKAMLRCIEEVSSEWNDEP